MLRVNYEYSKTLLAFALGRCPFLYASSASVYGDGQRGFVEREECEEPLNVYAFSKFLFDRHVRAPQRRRQMAEHIRIGRQYPQIQQLLAYSFGLDDQEFIVAYETDDLPAFQDLVRDLRATEGRRATVRDVPQLVGIHRPLDEILHLIDGA